MTRRALGRGLGALLSAEKLTVESEEFLEVDIDLIDPSPVQPRTHFAEASLNELSRSIQENGIVQPLLVRRMGSRFELVAGERRWRAAQLAGLARVPAVARDIPDDKLLELALIENIQREDLNPIEEANAYQKLLDTIGLTHDSLAERIGRDRSYITNYIRLLRLPEDLQRLVEEGRLSTGHARTLLGLNDVDLQRRVARKVIEKELSVRQTERAVRQILDGAKAGDREGPKAKSNDANLRAAESKLRRHFGTRVRIIQDHKGPGGAISLTYYNLADLDRLYRLLLPAAETS